MGEQNVTGATEPEDLRSSVRRIIRDINALDRMLELGMIESDHDRIGAEQEYFLVNDNWRPVNMANELLEVIKGIDVTPELARFNLEMNLPPLDFEGGCFSELEKLLVDGFETIHRAARDKGCEVMIAGILPTLMQSDMTLENMMDLPRYHMLNEAIMNQREGDYIFRIKGTDELVIKHSNVMVETCNTSFQIHAQIRPNEFPVFYNVAQLIAAPVLACATNSPLLFGKRLWRETRIALFQQSLDTRRASSDEREFAQRVSFGDGWINKSVVEIFQEDIARHRILLGNSAGEDPMKMIEEGKAPGLDALRLHNGTVYRWNRPCYGVADGKAHLRIENRLLPAGPTFIDEVANAAFWLGLLRGAVAEYGDIRERMDFDEARGNLTTAAYRGLGAHLTWLDGEHIASEKLILERLIPLAAAGLQEMNVDKGDIDRYLGVIEKRTSSGLTGSQWALSSLAAMKVNDHGSKAEQLAALTAGMSRRQQLNRPVHEWDLASLDESGGWRRHFRRLEQFMQTDLFTVNQNEAVDLVACMMDWRHIRHIPVEDDDHRLVGLVSHRRLVRLMAQGRVVDDDHPMAVHEIMHRNLITVPPHTSTIDAIRLMRAERIACLPVVRGDRLVGLVTESDFLRMAGALLEDALSDESEAE